MATNGRRPSFFASCCQLKFLSVRNTECWEKGKNQAHTTSTLCHRGCFRINFVLVEKDKRPEKDIAASSGDRPTCNSGNSNQMQVRIQRLPSLRLMSTLTPIFIRPSASASVMVIFMDSSSVVCTSVFLKFPTPLFVQSTIVES